MPSMFTNTRGRYGTGLVLHSKGVAAFKVLLRSHRSAMRDNVYHR